LSALKSRLGDADSEIVSFSDGEVIRALGVITERRPKVVALDRAFAATPRGAALINRLKADPTLADSEIRIVSNDGDGPSAPPGGSTPEPPPQHQKKPASASPLKSASPSRDAKATSSRDTKPAAGSRETKTATTTKEPPKAVQPLDQRGTRRAQRFKVRPEAGVLVDGNNAALVDISTVGAQVVTPTIVKPNQRVRLSLTDTAGAIRFNAVVAWAKFEIPAKSAPQYRAGLDFLDANSTAVEAYCQRHKTQ
jgi:hypothetical protein